MKEKIQLKGLLFVVNFQLERFDYNDQEVLLLLNQMFPYKAFWKHILIIFTHYFGDLGGDEDEMINEMKEINGEILKNLMNKVKNVSDIINYNEIKTKYLNSFWPIRKQRQIVNNEKVRIELEEELGKFVTMIPLI